jgi:hypothetical protein
MKGSINVTQLQNSFALHSPSEGLSRKAQLLQSVVVVSGAGLYEGISLKFYLA